MLVAGVDEAGRGPLAGPVFAAAVILNPDQPIVGLMDSKKLSEKRRQALYEQIHANALSVAIAQASVEEIDQLNILQASLLAMNRAVDQLLHRPTKVYVDGNHLPSWSYDSEAVIKGDQTMEVISAASILAKVARDQVMLTLDRQYPEYQFAKHKGYGTKLHLEALSLHGPSPSHRRSFAPVRVAQMKSTV